MIRTICDPLEVQRKVRLFPTEMIKGTSLEKVAFELSFEGQAAYRYPGTVWLTGVTVVVSMLELELSDMDSQAFCCYQGKIDAC